ncbi:MAG: glycosyltransferase [Anaerolineae bacterium]|nr:glycosyltransferase [Thermoflexales bacterium]MDW8407718.1 glycosyltransferase [Anaerolineae bacterium]
METRSSELTTAAEQSPFLSVVIPAYNERDNIQAGALSTVADYLSAQPYAYEVVVVDDGSEDDTAALAEAFAKTHDCFRVVREPHRGKAHTVIAGMLAARGAIVLFSDMDQATPITEIAQVLPWFERGFDVVIGSRGAERRNAPLWRKFMSRSQIVLRNLILGFQGITDTQCGFKAFRREAVRAIVPRLSLYGGALDGPVKGAAVTSGFDVEMLFVARKLGFQIKEVPVEWDYRHSRRVNLLKDSLRGVRDLVRIRLADWRGAYGRAHPQSK